MDSRAAGALGVLLVCVACESARSSIAFPEGLGASVILVAYSRGQPARRLAFPAGETIELEANADADLALFGYACDLEGLGLVRGPVPSGARLVDPDAAFSAKVGDSSWSALDPATIEESGRRLGLDFRAPESCPHVTVGSLTHFPPGTGSAWATTLVALDDHRFVAGTYPSGELLVGDLSAGLVESSTASSSAQGLLLADDGRLWVLDLGGRVLVGRLEGEPWVAVAETDLSRGPAEQNRIAMLEGADASVYILDHRQLGPTRTRTRLLRVRGSEVMTLLDREDPMGGGNVRHASLVRQGERVRFTVAGSYVGALDEASEQISLRPAPGGFVVEALATDERGHLWLGTQSGNVFEEAAEAFEERVPRGPARSVEAIVASGDGLWVFRQGVQVVTIRGEVSCVHNPSGYMAGTDVITAARMARRSVLGLYRGGRDRPEIEFAVVEASPPDTCRPADESSE
ncbi:MAG: hypothetical protein HYV07_23585 [Deltaproteobacteria bacterium]|nr:hypothetical protein [Deltaproteobacteria bacterium]